MLRDTIQAATVTAMKAKDKDRLAALRLIGAKIKDRDIEERGLKAKAEGRAVEYTADLEPITQKSYTPPASDDAMITDVLMKMAKQRRESIEMYETGGRQELADKEKGELAVIEEFLPRQMSVDETRAAIAAIKAEIGAEGMKDMGKLMGELKARHGASLDMTKASGLVKEALS